MTADGDAQAENARGADDAQPAHQRQPDRVLTWLKAPLHVGISAAVVFALAVAAYFLLTQKSPTPVRRHPTHIAQAKGRVVDLPQGLDFTLAPGWKVTTDAQGHGNILLTHTDPSALLSVNYTAGNLVSVSAALRADVPRFLGPDASALRAIHVIATNRDMFDQLAEAGFDFLSSSGKVLSYNGEAIELLRTQTGQRVLMTFIPPNLATLKALTPGVDSMIFSLAEN